MNTAIATTKRVYRSEPMEQAGTASARGNMAKIILPCLMVLATGIAYVWLQSNTETLQRKNSSLRAQNENLLRQLSNLRIDRETYTSRNEILKRVAEFQLDLRPPMVGQTRRVSLRRPPAPTRETSRGLLAGRLPE